jgi:hypothetical protein
MVSKKVVETDSNISRNRAIPAETCGNQRVNCIHRKPRLSTNRAELRSSGVRLCPKSAWLSGVVDLISDALPFGRLWYGEPDAVSNAIGFAKFFSRSRDAVIRVYDEAGNVTETHEHAGDFEEP